MRSARVAPVGALVVLAAAFGSARPVYGFGYMPPTGDNPGSIASSVALGDVTGDGLTDAVLTTGFAFDPASDYRVYVYPQLPDGSLGAAASYPYGPGSGAPLALADLDEDGVQDVIVGNGLGGIVFLADGSGGLLPGVTTPSVVAGVLATGDIDRDGHADVVAAKGGAASILYGDGAGGFRSVVPFALDVGALDIKVKDLDGDGLPDLAVLSPKQLRIYRNDGAGGFGTTPDVYVPDPASLAQSFGVGVGDANGDGRNDAVLTQWNPTPTKLWLYLQGADGVLTGPAALPNVIYRNPNPVVVADASGDGLDDIVVLHSGMGVAGVYYQQPGGAGPGPEQIYFVPNTQHYGVEAVAVGDLNDDGCPDVAIAQPGLTLLRGRDCGGSCSDADGDGYSAAGGACGPIDCDDGAAAVHPGALEVPGNAVDENCDGVAACASPQVSNYSLQPYLLPGDPGSRPDTLAVGDVTGDGRPDVVMTTAYGTDPPNDYHVFVYPQLADGSLGAPAGYYYGAQANQSAIVLADLNGDRVADVVVGHSSGVSVLLADGAGGLLPAAVYADKKSDLLAALDIDRDGAVDVVSLGRTGGAEMFFGDGAGGFKSKARFPMFAEEGGDLKVGDFDGDGLADLASIAPLSVTIHRHDPAGFMRPFPATYSLSVFVSGLGLGDFNGDGLLDVALSGSGNSPVNLSIFTQTPGQDFAGPATLPTQDTPHAVLAGDFDGDGRDDAAVVSGSKVGLYLQRSCGAGLAAETLYAMPPSASASMEAAAFGDLDSDGCTDFAVANFEKGPVILHGRNCIPPPCRDADGDGYGSPASPACAQPAPDCNDASAAIHPGAAEVPGNGLNDDCDPATPDCPDADHDGYSSGGGVCGAVDCNDANAAIQPGATEISGDGVDNDCNPATPDCPDADGDGYSAAGGACGPVDCNDGNAAVHPGGPEIAGDGVDNDCNHATPDCPDADGDGYSGGGGACGPADCNDGNAAIHPGATEIPGNGVDENCDGSDGKTGCGTIPGSGGGIGALLCYAGIGAAFAFRLRRSPPDENG